MGVWPAVYAALLVPSRGRGGDGAPPAWPFVVGSFALGAFALMPYFALTLNGEPDAEQPPEQERTLAVRVLESKAFAASLLASTAALGAVAANAVVSTGGGAWDEYLQLFGSVKLVNVTSVDFLTLSLWAPFWCARDAERRGADAPGALTAVPIIGPALYLLRR
eukprot:PRCOL_00003549-RA